MFRWVYCPATVTDSEMKLHHIPLSESPFITRPVPSPPLSISALARCGCHRVEKARMFGPGYLVLYGLKCLYLAYPSFRTDLCLWTVPAVRIPRHRRLHKSVLVRFDNLRARHRWGALTITGCGE